MAKIIAMYKTPADPAAFDRYYFGPHVKLAKAVPGLKGYEVTRGPVMTPAGPAPFYLVAILTFESMAAKSFSSVCDRLEALLVPLLPLLPFVPLAANSELR